MNFIFDPVFITILIFGVITSYTDIRYGKIKNYSIIGLLAIGLIINIFFTKTLSVPSLSISSDFIQTISNVIIATILGFSLWLAGLLSEGDAKLFIGFSLLLPVFLYQHGYLFLFPAIVILVNTVVPVAIFLVIRGLTRMKGGQIKELRHIFSFHNFLTTAIFIFGFSFLLKGLFDYFNAAVNFILQIFILFVLMEILNRFTQKNILPISIIVSLIDIIFFYNSIISVQFISQFILLFVLLQCMVIIFHAVDFSFGREMKINQLKPGMAPGEKLVKIKGNYVKYQSSFTSLFDLFNSIKDYFSQDLVYKLDKGDIKNLKMLQRENRLKFDSIKIVETVPFAPFMFMGVLLTYFLQGSIIFYFQYLL